MIYEEYYQKYLDYKKTRKIINDLENKRLSLISMVDVQSTTPNTGRVSSKKEDKFLIYTGELEEVELLIQNNQKVLDLIIKRLETIETELRNSDEILDKVYLYKYIDHLKYYQIAVKIGYEKTKTYDLINDIKLKISEINQFTEKNGKN